MAGGEIPSSAASSASDSPGLRFTSHSNVACRAVTPSCSVSLRSSRASRRTAGRNSAATVSGLSVTSLIINLPKSTRSERVGGVSSRPMSEPTASREHDARSTLSDPLVRELVAARLVCLLATLRPGGGIHAVPMWYAAQDDAVVLATGSRSRKVRHLEADWRATLVLHDSRPGYEVCGASIAGTVEVVRGPGAKPLVKLVHDRYLAPESAGDPRVRAFLESDDVALRLTPTGSVTWDERGSEASEVVRERGWGLPLLTTEPRP